MQIIQDTITLIELKKIAQNLFGDMVKAVVDVEKEIIAIDAELHADLESLLLQQGSKQVNLWGINLYPELPGSQFIEFDSMINIRPSVGNKSRSVENGQLCKRIIEIVAKRIK
jgi:hypothetical protein